MTELYRVGQVVLAGDGFALTRKLGAGTFGTVYEAFDLVLRRPVAIKILRPEAGQSIARMQREWQTLGRLRHPHIVQVLSAGYERGPHRAPFFTMPLLVGAPLRSMLERKGRLPLDRCIQYATQLLAALDEAHRSDVVHRDVKPENVFLERISARVHAVVLLDFGLVTTRGERSATLHGLVGTPAYAAPEVFCGDRPSVQSDLYSAALVLFEMMTGVHPLVGAGHWGTAHRCTAPAPLDRFLPGAPPALVNLLDAMLAKDPTQRPESAAWCLARLGWIQQDFAVEENAVTTEDQVDSLLRKIGGPTADEVTQVDPPTSTLLRESGKGYDTEVAPPPSSRKWAG